MKKIIAAFLIVFISACNSGDKKTAADIPFNKILACTFSQIVYSNFPDSLLKKYLPEWKLVWNPAPLNGNYAFVAVHENKMAIAIRGSVLQFDKAAFDNWIRQDFNVVTQKTWPHTDTITNAKISEGSFEAFQNMQLLKDRSTGKTIWQFIEKTTDKNTRLLVTGHSLGGNLSTVFASWLNTALKKQNKQVKKTEVITFASPAAGNEAFAKDFNKKFPDAILVENTNDIAPKFPVANSVGNLSLLYTPSPAANNIDLDFSFINLKLSTIFDGLRLTLKGMEVYNGNSVYTQPKTEFITIKLSGAYTENKVENFFMEAKHQHGVEQYASAVGAPVIKSN